MAEPIVVEPWDAHNRALVENVHPATWTNPEPAARYRDLGVDVFLGAGRFTGPDTVADARLLAAHVRPATIAGVRLDAVDYAALRADPDYARALADLAGERREDLRTDGQAIAFWVNAYNLLAIKAVADREYALHDIEHGILRARFCEPRIHMALVCASLSCPDLRPEPYVADRLDAQLDGAARRFLGNPTKGVVPGPDGRTARVSSIFRWFAADFGGNDGVVRFIRSKAEPALARRLGDLQPRGLSYLDYDWSLNDARRAGEAR